MKDEIMRQWDANKRFCRNSVDTKKHGIVVKAISNSDHTLTRSNNVEKIIAYTPVGIRAESDPKVRAHHRTRLALRKG